MNIKEGQTRHISIALRPQVEERQLTLVDCEGHCLSNSVVLRSETLIPRYATSAVSDSHLLLWLAKLLIATGLRSEIHIVTGSHFSLTQAFTFPDVRDYVHKT